jgi:hypothetical protein
MAEPFSLRMRKLDLTLPDSYEKPATKVFDWLQDNAKFLSLWGDVQILQHIRSALGLQISALDDAYLSAIVQAWLESRGYRPAGKAAKARENEIVSRVKRIFGSIPTSVVYKGDQGTAAISVSGVTAALYAGKMQYEISRTWTGCLQFKTQTRGAVFSASMAPDKWNLTFTLGRLSPNISDLETVFKKGEAALRGALGDLGKIDWKNASKTKQIFDPYLDPIKTAVDAASKTAVLKPGEWNVSAWIGGGIPGGGGGGGVSGGALLTIVF